MSIASGWLSVKSGGRRRHRRLRAARNGPQLPVIMLTALGEEADRRTATDQSGPG